MSEQDTLHLVGELFEEADRAKRRLLPAFDRYYRYLRNRPTLDQRGSSYTTGSQISDIFPTLHTFLSWMTDSAPRFACSALPDFPSPTLAEIIEQKTKDFGNVLEAWWFNWGAYNQEWLGVFDALTYGTGIWRTGWEEHQADGHGEPSLLRVNPYCFLPDPLAVNLDDCRYIGEVRDVALQDIELRWPEAAPYVVPSTKPTQRRQPEPGGGGQLISQFRSTGVTGAFPGTPTLGVPPMFGTERRGAETYTGRVTLKEFWIKEVTTIPAPWASDDRPASVQIPAWRYIATANEILLEDSPNPFPHGQLPYVTMPCVDVGEFWGIPLTEHLGPVQQAQNEIMTTIALNARLVGSPILLNPVGSGIERQQFRAQPGAVYDVNPGLGSEIRWLEPPKLETWLTNYLDRLQTISDRISGITSVARGASLRRREPAEAVDATQEASFVRVRAIIRNMEEALRKAMNLIGSNIVELMTDERTVALPRAQDGPSHLHLGRRHFWIPKGLGDDTFVPMRFLVQVESGSTHPLSRAARVSEYDHLFAMLGPAVLVQMLKARGIPNAEKIKDEFFELHKAGIGPSPTKGKTKGA